MKTTFLPLILMSSVLSGTVLAQPSEREAAAQEVAAYVRTVNEAAAIFLDRRLRNEARLAAIAPHALVFDAKQVEGFKRILLDAHETPEIRSAALARIVAHIAGDERVDRQVGEWLAEPATPPVLRKQALAAEASTTFATMRIRDVYQKLLDDPDPDFRVFAFTKLVIHGDPRAQQKLIAGLLEPASAPLPAPVAIAILSMAPKKEYYPALFEVARTTTDAAARLEAVRALGFYAEARSMLVTITRDDRETPELREAALAALYAGDRDNIVRYVAPLLVSPTAPERLKAAGIQMTIDVRQAMSRRATARKDSYDRLIERLSREAADPAVRAVAVQYVQSVRPR
ncbi:MAG TPA: hypothetical protein VGF48_05935 [Thermoanaerobaculia bacterium]|jgi:hypothetical protein